jgi:hypothetical protein
LRDGFLLDVARICLPGRRRRSIEIICLEASEFINNLQLDSITPWLRLVQLKTWSQALMVAYTIEIFSYTTAEIARKYSSTFPQAPTFVG